MQSPRITDDADVNEALERLDRALTHPRILAAKAVAEFRGRELSQPWINTTTGSGAPLLNRDAVVHSAEPRHAPNVSEQRRRSLLGRLLFWR